MKNELISKDYTKEEFRCAVQDLEVFLLENGAKERTQEDTIYPLIHRFAGGMYCREIFMPAGAILTTMIHCYDHFAFILTGKAIVYTEDGEEVIEAPRVLITKAGTKRAIRILEDMRWATVHITSGKSEDDLVQIEKELTARTYTDYLEHVSTDNVELLS